MKTILDANIFYNLVDGSVDMEAKVDLNAYTTNTNIDEFVRSGHLLNRPKFTAEVIRKAMDFTDKRMLPRNPFMYVLELDGQDFELTPHDKFILKFSRNLARAGTLVIDDDEKETVARFWIKERQQQLKRISGMHNDWWLAIQEKYGGMTKKIGEEEFDEFAQANLKEMILNWTKSHLDYATTLSPQFDWAQLELFIKTYMRYFRSGASKPTFKPNDVNDLFQLLYVQPGDKYWTRER